MSLSAASCSWLFPRSWRRRRTLAPTYGDRPVADYADRTAEAVTRSQDGTQEGDPAKLAAAPVTVAGLEKSPLRFIAGVDAVDVAERKAADLRAQVDAFRDLSTSLGLDHPRKYGVTQ